MKKPSKFTPVMALLAVTLFALCLLLVLLTGARVYRTLVHRGSQGFAARTAAQYITTRVRQADRIRLEEFADHQALVIPETLDGENYVTRIYCREGWLWELYCPEDAALSPEDGERVLEADSLEFVLEGPLLTVTMDGQRLYLHVPTEQEVLP